MTNKLVFVANVASGANVGIALSLGNLHSAAGWCTALVVGLTCLMRKG